MIAGRPPPSYDEVRKHSVIKGTRRTASSRKIGKLSLTIYNKVRTRDYFQNHASRDIPHCQARVPKQFVRTEGMLRLPRNVRQEPNAIVKVRPSEDRLLGRTFHSILAFFGIV
jgi:hypothetical protein